MRKTFIAFALSILTTSTFAFHTCDTLPTPKKQDNCWGAIISDNIMAADEYVRITYMSDKVPWVVKDAVAAKWDNILPEAKRDCKIINNMPERSCYVQKFQDFKDYTYEQTHKYGVPDLRYD
jgi:hypothetical protein